MLKNLLRKETERQTRRVEEGRLNDEDREQMQVRLRDCKRAIVKEGVRENFLPLAAEMVPLSCSPCLDLKLCLLARPGVHVWS